MTSAYSIDGVHNVDFVTMVRAGQVSGWTSEFKFGFTDSVSSTESVIRTTPGVVPYTATPQTITVSSSSALDTVAGDGARTVEVQIINDLGIEEFITLPLLGQTPVVVPTSRGTVSGKGDMINRAQVQTKGDPDFYAGNLGTIYVGYGTVTAGVPANIFTQIDVGESGDLGPKNQSLGGVYKVPAGKEAYLSHFFGSAKRNSDVDFALYIQAPGSVFQIKGIAKAVGGNFPLPILSSSAIPPGALIETRAKSTGGTSASSILQMLLRDIPAR